jgi:DNA gyrase subunit B
MRAPRCASWLGQVNRPDGTFSNLDYSFKTLENRLRELAFLNSGVRIIIEDERPAEPLRTELFYEGGVQGIRQIP